MFSDERRQQIVEILKNNRFANVCELAKQFYTSEATIRRDLDKLKKTGVLKRTYGGATIVEGIDAEIPLVVREDESPREKEMIAYAAAQLINEGDVIIIDSSSTCEKLVPHLVSKKPKTVITNSPKTALLLSQINGLNIYSTGGHLRSHSLSYVGEPARNMIASFYVDILFFSCRGASIEHGLTDPSEDEAELKRLMLQHAAKKVALLDSRKIDQNGFVKICDFTQIDYLVTEKELCREWLDYLKKNKVELLFAT